MFKKSDFDSSWQEVSVSANNSPPPTSDTMAARQTSSSLSTQQHFQRADSSFEHIDESIMVLNSLNPSMMALSPDKQPSIQAPVMSNPSLALINAKLDLYSTQIDRFLNTTPKRSNDADLAAEQNYMKYAVKLRSEVEALKTTASNYLSGQERNDQSKASLIKSNLGYDLGKLDELMNNFYLNDCASHIDLVTSSSSTTSGQSTSTVLESSSFSLANDYNNSQAMMTLSSSIDVLSLASDLQRASMIQEKVLEQNRLLKEMIKKLSLTAPVPKIAEPAEPVVETQSIPINPSATNEEEDLGFVTSFTPGSSPSEFSMMTGPSNRPNISLSTSIISLTNKIFGKKPKQQASSASMTSSQSCTINCLDNTSVAAAQSSLSNGGNTYQTSDEDDDENTATLSSEVEATTRTKPESLESSQAAGSDVQRKALNLFYSCPKCNVTIYKDETTFEKYTEHIKACYHPNHSCFFCWKLFEPNEFEAFQRHVHDHLDQANEDGFITF